MSTYAERLHLSLRQKNPRIMVLSLFFFSAGLLAGYHKAKFQAHISDCEFVTPNLKEYQSEDMINFEIDKTSKPAVIYYYQPSSMYHYVLRQGFLRCSSRYSENANFYMVNIMQNLMLVEEELQHRFPFDRYLMEIRFPRGKCEIKYTNEQIEEKQTYRRQFFHHQYRKSYGMEDFLQQNGIKPEQNPMQDIFNLNRECLFSQHIKQTSQ